MLFKGHKYYLIIAISAYLTLAGCTTGNYSIYRSEILNYYPKAGHGHIVDPVKNVDPLVDTDVVVYMALNNFGKTYDIHYKLYRPNGSLFHSSRNKMFQHGPYSFIYDTYSIKSISLSLYPGEWSAEIYIDGTLAKTMKFNMIEREDLVNNYREFVKNAKYYKAGILFHKAIYSPILKSLNVTWEENYGMAVEKIQDDSPAEKGGLKPGDIILEINNDKIYSVEECVDSFAYSSTPDKTIVHLYRPSLKEYITLNLELALMEESDLLYSHAVARDFERKTKKGHNKKVQ